MPVPPTVPSHLRKVCLSRFGLCMDKRPRNRRSFCTPQPFFIFHERIVTVLINANVQGDIAVPRLALTCAICTHKHVRLGVNKQSCECTYRVFPKQSLVNFHALSTTESYTVTKPFPSVVIPGMLPMYAVRLSGISQRRTAKETHLLSVLKFGQVPSGFGQFKPLASVGQGGENLSSCCAEATWVGRGRFVICHTNR